MDMNYVSISWSGKKLVLHLYTDIQLLLHCMSLIPRVWTIGACASAHEGWPRAYFRKLQIRSDL